MLLCLHDTAKKVKKQTDKQKQQTVASLGQWEKFHPDSKTAIGQICSIEKLQVRRGRAGQLEKLRRSLKMWHRRELEKQSACPPPKPSQWEAEDLRGGEIQHLPHQACILRVWLCHLLYPLDSPLFSPLFINNTACCLVVTMEQKRIKIKSMLPGEVCRLEWDIIGMDP